MPEFAAKFQAMVESERPQRLFAPIVEEKVQNLGKLPAANLPNQLAHQVALGPGGVGKLLAAKQFGRFAQWAANPGIDEDVHPHFQWQIAECRLHSAVKII